MLPYIATVIAEKVTAKIKDVARGDYTGFKEFYYDSGEKYGEGNFKYGRKIGEWTYYHITGEKLSVVEYTNDAARDQYLIKNAKGFNTDGSQNETSIKTSFFKSGGIRIGYSLDGKRLIKSTYENGWMHGAREDRYLNHRVALRGTYNASYKTGEWVGWDESGNEVFRKNFD